MGAICIHADIGFQLECGVATPLGSLATLNFQVARTDFGHPPFGQILHGSQVERHSPVKRCIAGSTPARAANAIGTLVAGCLRRIEVAAGSTPVDGSSLAHSSTG